MDPKYDISNTHCIDNAGLVPPDNHARRVSAFQSMHETAVAGTTMEGHDQEVYRLVADQGDLIGRGFKAKLQAMDRVASTIARHVQRSGGTIRSSKRYCAWVAKAHGFIATEINRVINRLIEVRRPSKLYLEKLDFRMPACRRG